MTKQRKKEDIIEVFLSKEYGCLVKGSREPYDGETVERYVGRKVGSIHRDSGGFHDTSFCSKKLTKICSEHGANGYTTHVVDRTHSRPRFDSEMRWMQPMGNLPPVRTNVRVFKGMESESTYTCELTLYDLVRISDKEK